MFTWFILIVVTVKPYSRHVILYQRSPIYLLYHVINKICVNNCCWHRVPPHFIRIRKLPPDNYPSLYRAVDRYFQHTLRETIEGEWDERSNQTIPFSYDYDQSNQYEYESRRSRARYKIQMSTTYNYYFSVGKGWPFLITETMESTSIIQTITQVSVPVRRVSRNEWNKAGFSRRSRTAISFPSIVLGLYIYVYIHTINRNSIDFQAYERFFAGLVIKSLVCARVNFRHPYLSL